MWRVLPAVAPSPSMIVTISWFGSTSSASSLVAASLSSVSTARMPSRAMPSQSPSAMGPTSQLDARTAWVSSPATTDAAASPISSALDAPSASGSYTTSAAKPSVIPLVGTTWTDFDVCPSTCSATGMMFLLFGRMTTWSAGTCSTA